jgi:hypothetical protein
MTPANHPHSFKAFDGGVGSLHPLKAARRPDHTLERSMVSLNDVIQIFRSAVLDMMR